jgi:hypothetical protein
MQAVGRLTGDRQKGRKAEAFTRYEPMGITDDTVLRCSSHVTRSMRNIKLLYSQKQLGFRIQTSEQLYFQIAMALQI